jgi:hypothetical protein
LPLSSKALLKGDKSVKKFTKSDYDAATNLGAARLSSNWTTGSGRSKKARSIRGFMKKFYKDWEKESHPPHVKALFEKHPLAKAVIAITDLGW